MEYSDIQCFPRLEVRESGKELPAEPTGTPYCGFMPINKSKISLKLCNILVEVGHTSRGLGFTTCTAHH